MGGDVASRLTAQERRDISVLTETMALLLSQSARMGLVSAKDTQGGWERLRRVNEMVWNDEQEEEKTNGNGYR